VTKDVGCELSPRRAPSPLCKCERHTQTFRTVRTSHRSHFSSLCDRQTRKFPVFSLTWLACPAREVSRRHNLAPSLHCPPHGFFSSNRNLDACSSTRRQPVTKARGRARRRSCLPPQAHAPLHAVSRATPHPRDAGSPSCSPPPSTHTQVPPVHFWQVPDGTSRAHSRSPPRDVVRRRRAGPRIMRRQRQSRRRRERLRPRRRFH